MTSPSWQYDEMIHIGKDFTDIEVVESYETRHRKFRDIDKENEDILADLDLREGDSFADFGSGTGALVLMAARRCAKVYAVDISQSMLNYTKMKAEKQGLANIAFCHAGFLTYVHEGEPLNAISTSMALHHLPDFWKFKALQRLNGMLKEGGRFFLFDVIYSEKNIDENIEAWIVKITGQTSPEMAEDIRRHIRKEYSTLTWIMEGLLARAGFRIDRSDHIDGVLARYVCTKKA